MSFVTSVRKAVRDRLIARAGGIDFSRLDKVPDSLSWPLQRDVMAPNPRLSAAREADPVQRLASLLGMDVWLVTGDAESRQVLSDATSYSTDIRPYMGKRGSTTDGDFGGLGFTDPPDHTKLRRLLMPEFTMRRLERIRPGIASIVDKQIAEIEAAGASGDTVDLVPTFAFPIPFLVICDLLGLPDEKRETFSKLATARFDISQGAQSSMDAVGGSREFLLAETARQRKNPGPGLIGQIIREHGDEINDFDLGGLADGVFTGGLETSASMLALGTAVLLENRELWGRLVSEPDSVGPIVDELLRVLSVVQVVLLLAVLQGLLGIDPANQLLLIGIALATGAVFTAINQMFVALFGGAGRFAALVFVSLQLTSAGGTYPIETAPPFFNVLHDLLPMTYAVHGLRAALAGGTDGVVRDFLVLGAFTALALAVTVIAARRRQTVTVARLHPTLVV